MREREKRERDEGEINGCMCFYFKGTFALCTMYVAEPVDGPS